MKYLKEDLYRWYVELNTHNLSDKRDEKKELKAHKAKLVRQADKFISLLLLGRPNIKDKYEDTELRLLPVSKKEVSLKNYQIERFNEVYTEIVEANIRLEELGNLERSVVNNDIFDFVIKQFNTAIIDEILKGYTLNMREVGVIKLINKPRKGLNIDWEASNIIKAKLIEQGELPYKVIDRMDDGTPISNGGKKWLVAFNSPKHHWYVWYKYMASMYKNEDFRLMKYYGLLLCSYKGGIVRKLAVLKLDKYAELRFEP